MSKMKFTLLLAVLLLGGCGKNNPERLEQKVLSFACEEISVIKLNQWKGSNDNLNNMLLMITPEEKCAMLDLIKSTIRKKHRDYLPINTYTIYLDVYLYNEKSEPILEISTGLMEDNRGFVMFYDKRNEPGFIDFKTVESRDFFDRILKLMQENTVIKTPDK